MSRRFVLTLTLILGIVAVGVLPTVSAQDEAVAHVRIVHAVPDAPAVDLLIDGALAAAQVPYAGYTNYLSLSDGGHTLSVQAGGSAILQASINAAAGESSTVFITGSAAAPEITVFENDTSPLALGNARLDAINLSDSGDLDVIFSDGSPVLLGVAPGSESEGSIDIPANTYPLAIAPAGGSVGEAVVAPDDYALRAGMAYQLVALAGDPAVLLLQTPVEPEGDSVWVRAVHAIPGAPSVDVYLNESLLIPGLASGDVTEHVALPLGTYDLSLRTAGSDSTAAPIASLSLDLSDSALAGLAQTIAAVNQGGAPGLVVFEDDLSALDATQARVSVFNAAAGTTVSASLDDGTALADGVAFGEASAAIEVPAAVSSVSVSTDDGEVVLDGQVFTGGVAYALIITGTPEQPVVLLGENALNQQPGSAVSIVAEAPVETEETVEVTEAPTEEAAEPAVQPTQPPPPPTAVPAGTGIIARVNLNPGANTNLRQFPNSDALVLAQAASGTILEVLGRAGEPDFVGLVDLPQFDDLAPETVWVSAIYTGEGGEVRGWVRADALAVTEAGETVRLADLEPLPSNVAGAQISVAAPVATAVPPSADFYGEVINLNPGSRLNIRLGPDPQEQILERLQLGDVVTPLGILESLEWTFIEYAPAGGGAIRGWVSTNFLKFVYEGEDFYPTTEDIEEMFLAGASLQFVDGTERGEIGIGTELRPTPTPNDSPFRDQVVATTVLNPNVSLHLRLTPSEAGDSLALIPNGATMPVTGRTVDSQWLHVEYEGQDGWISAQYVELRLNGERVDLLSVPEVQP